MLYYLRSSVKTLIVGPEADFAVVDLDLVLEDPGLVETTCLDFLRGSETRRLVDRKHEEPGVLGCAGSTRHPVDGAR